jgi:uncharacterized repeat protein (TIGR01451 family)
MTSPFRPRAICAAALLAGFVAAAMLPGSASAAQPASLRLLGTDSQYRSVQLITPTGQRSTASPGLFRLRITPTGGSPVERRGFCVDVHHGISGGVDYQVSLRTAAEEPLLDSPRYGEAAWLVQQAEPLIAAALPSARTLEAGALQVAVWQLTDQLRESGPTSDAPLNVRAAALRLLAAGRGIAGPIGITPQSGTSCAGGGPVPLRLTGRPGSVASLSATAGAVVAPAQVRFDPTGVATATVVSGVPGGVSVTAAADGGDLTRAARAGSGNDPQETIFITPAAYSSAATVEFEDCVARLRVRPPGTTIPLPEAPGSPLSEHERPAGQPPPGSVTPRRPHQSTPTFTVVKTGPQRAAAGSTVTYRIRVRNRGRGALRGLLLRDDLPAGMSLAAIPAGSSLRGGRLVWTLAPLGAGDSRSLLVTVRIDEGITGRRCNRATAAPPGLPPVHASACTTITSTPTPRRPAVAA